MTDSPTALLPIALEAVTIAGDLMRSRLPGLLTPKGDRDMVTDIDYSIERAIRRHLRRTTPAISILGEEEGVTGHHDSAPMWTIDPVDGTANFVRGIPLCGISLGLIDKKKPVLGVIDLPFLGTRYSAAENTGARLGDRRLQTSMTTELKVRV